MPTLVGEALVRVRLITTGLSNDIKNAVKDAVGQASPDLNAHGRTMGSNISHGISTGMRSNDAEIKSAGREVGAKFGDSVDNEIKNSGTKISNSAKTVVRKAARESVQGADKEIDGEVRKWSFKEFGKVGGKASGEFKKAFNVGIGAARMGPAIISAIALAAPSVVSGLGAVGTAAGGALISAVAAVGPGLTGALVGAGAAFMSLGLSAGLLLAGFKALGTEGKQLSEDFQNLKTEFGKPIGLGMLSGMTDAVATLRAAVPHLNDLLTATGVAAGDAARSFARTITSASNLDRLRSILATNVTFMQNFATGVNGGATAMLILGKAMKPFVDYIGQGAARFGDWAASTLSAAEASGKLDAWIQSMLAHWKQLWGIIKDFGSGIVQVFKAASGPANAIMGSIASVAASFKAWTSSSVGQAKMLAFFDKSYVITSKVMEVIGKLAKAAGNAFVGMNTAPLLHVLDVLENRIGPAFASIFSQVKTGAGPNLLKVFDNIATALEKMAASGAFEKISKFMSGFLVVITNILATDFGSTILAWTVPLLLFGGIAEKMISPVVELVSALSGLTTGALAPFLGITAIAAAVVAAFVAMYMSSQKLRDAIDGLVQAVAGKFMGIWDSLWPKIEKAGTAFGNLARVIGDLLAPIFKALGPTVVLAMDVIGKVIGTALDWIAGLFTLFADLLSGNWGALWTDLVSLVTTFVDNVGGVFGSAWNTIWALAIQPILDLKTAIANWFTGTLVPWLSANWTKIPGLIAAALLGLGGRLVSAFGEGLKALGAWFLGTAIPWFGDRYVEIVDAAVAGLKGIGAAFLNAFDAGRLVLGSWFTGTFIPWLKDQWRVALTTPPNPSNPADVRAPFEQNKTWLGEWFDNTFIPWLKGKWQMALVPPITASNPESVRAPFEQSQTWLGEWWDGTFVPWMAGKWSSLVGTVNVGLQDVWPVVARKFEEIRLGIGAWFTGFVPWVYGQWVALAGQPLAALSALPANVMTWFGSLGASIHSWFFGETATEGGAWQTIAALPAILVSLPGNAMTWFGQLGANIGSWFNNQVGSHRVNWQTIAALPAILGSMPGRAMSFFYNLGGSIGSWFSGMNGQISSAWVVIAGLPAVLGSMVARAMTFFYSLGSSISGFFSGLISNISGWFSQIAALPGQLLGGMGSAIAGALSGVAGALTAPFTGAWNTISGIIDNIKGAVGAVTSAFNFITGQAGAIAAASSAAIRAAEIGQAPLATRGGGGSFGTPATVTPRATSGHPVMLAAGGIVRPVDGGLLAVIAEGRRSERVEPLNANGLSSRDEALITHIVRAMTAQQSAALDVNVSLNPNGLESVMDAVVTRREGALARRLQYGRPR